ncbi:MAG: citrate synthase [Alphaproteobacteria bacterium]|nr:citrate synthase [Alphaproteobacteria bacterium]
MADPKVPANDSNLPKAKLILPDGRELEFPVEADTIGDALSINVKGAFGKAKIFFSSPGYADLSAARSELTYIDGDNGILLYRGYPIEQLANSASFMEVCYLILNGELPTKGELTAFEKDIVNRMEVPEQLIRTLESLPRSTHPMAIMMTMTTALTAYLEAKIDPKKPEGRYEIALELIAKSATIGAMAKRYSLNQSIMRPSDRLGFVENFLKMTFANAAGEYDINPVLVRAMDRNLILHAEHEQNASTSTVRLSGSSGTSPIAAIGAGIATLWGPSHGGANEAVLEMLKRIGTVDNIPEFIAQVKSKGADATRLMGFGHRVYKNFDPRAIIIKQACDEVLKALGVDNPLLAVAKELERVALEDPYFKEKKLYPNVDFYSGIILSAMGYETKMFTPIFAVGRTVGWAAQWKEQADEKSAPIGRPRQLYQGRTQRDVIPMEQRGPNGDSARATLTAVADPKLAADAK